MMTTFRIHLTNIQGIGATQLALSLLPALESLAGAHVEELWLPDRGRLTNYSPCLPTTRIHRYKRRVSNALSRFFECMLHGRQFNAASPLLVLGDLPLRTSGPQTVFVQQPHLVKPFSLCLRQAFHSPHFLIGQLIFSVNAKFAQTFIVQTATMKDELSNRYPQIAQRIHVISQPAPSWLQNSAVRRTGRTQSPDAPLSLFYPAAGYPHKNHTLLQKINPADKWPVRQFCLTVAPQKSPAPHVNWLHCCGELDSAQMIKMYAQTDALVFLSNAESYGLPLVEAMFVGIPIICADLPYAHALCGNGAIYFDPTSVESLRLAILKLHTQLQSGWWPDWKPQLEAIPKDWASVAQSFVNIVCSSLAQT